MRAGLFLSIFILHLLQTVEPSVIERSNKGNLKDDFDFSGIDKWINHHIQNKTFPGCSLSVSNINFVIYENSYGAFTYQGEKLSQNPTTLNSIFDIASLTQVVATTSAVMYLYEKKLIKLEDLVFKYIPQFGNKGKQAITVRNLLLHNSGLPAEGPFEDVLGCDQSYVMNYIFNVNLEYTTGTKYVYSDFSMILLGEVVERVSKDKFQRYVEEKIFKPLEMNDTYFNPPENLWNRVIPTEYDGNFRKMLCHGFVHDPTSYIMGKAAGHAGVFSTSRDLQQFMVMMLNYGVYLNSRGTQMMLFEQETVKLFTTRVDGLPYQNSRALGWDTNPDGIKPCGERFSQNSFGHTGYTGTTIWGDYDSLVSIVILTNRVYPKAAPTADAIKYFRNSTYTMICDVLQIHQ